MSLLKPACSFAAAVCGVLLVASAAIADEASGDSVSVAPPKFTVTVERGEIVGNEQVQRAVIWAGTNQFLIVVPHGMRLESSPDKIVLIPSDYSYHLIFRMAGKIVADANSAAAYREFVLNRFPGANIVEEFSLTAAGHGGPAFDLLWTPPGVSECFVRVAFIPSAVGVLEFSMIADSKGSADAQINFKGLIGGFRSNERGKLEIIRFSDNS